MAASPSASSHGSPTPSASLKPSADHDAHAPPTSIDTLVNHLLVAKRSLSSMTLVLRANDLATAARNAHEDSLILAAQNCFLGGAMADQIAILMRVRRSIHATYEWSKRDFKKLLRAMDDVDGELGATMEMLRGTDVHPNLRPPEGERRNLLDFVDETGVDAMREAMKRSIQELQGIQQSLDGDLLRFETDIRNLNKTMSGLPLAGPDGRGATKPAADLLVAMDDDASAMAQLLASLTKHFDMCVTAMRTTEGAAALARRKAAEVTQAPDGDGVSLSGVIAEHKVHMSGLEPKTAEDRAEMLKVVTQDATEVDDVVREIQERLAAVERASAAVEEQARQTSRAHGCMLDAFAALADMGDRLADYLAAEDDFRERWELEKDAVAGRLRDMGDLRDFYEGYAGSFGSLVLEAERRRAVARQVEACWSKAQEGVNRLLDADGAAREAFHHDVGEFLPTDLWTAVQAPPRRWKLVPVDGGDDEAGLAGGTTATAKSGGA